LTAHAGKSVLKNAMLPAEIVLHPSWWHRHAGIDFDEDFFYNPARRIEAEREMERVLYDRFGRFGLGADRDADRPHVGAVHLAAGFLISEMLGCDVKYSEGAPPEVQPAGRADLGIDADAAFASPAFRRFAALCGALKKSHGFLTGDVNWGGILNVALDLRGEAVFMDMLDRPDAVRAFFGRIASVIERFTRFVEAETGTTSISVNRTVRHIQGPVFLHSECSHTMISAAHYESFLMEFDAQWSRARRPFGIHYCGNDAHRHAASFARLPRLDFLDVGWGSDVRALRDRLPDTFLNIRLDPVGISGWSTDEIRAVVTRLVEESEKPYLTGVCCINTDDRVGDEKIAALFETVAGLRRRYVNGRLQ